MAQAAGGTRGAAAGGAAKLSLAEPAEATPSASPDVDDNSHSLQVSVGAIIEMKGRIEWSTSPFAVTALMPRKSGNEGLLIGDRIISINGENVTRKETVDQLYKLLTGSRGSCVCIVVDRLSIPIDPVKRTQIDTVKVTEVTLSVPRSTLQEHFAGKVLQVAEIIFEGWMAKDGRFLSSFKR